MGRDDPIIANKERHPVNRSRNLRQSIAAIAWVCCLVASLAVADPLAPSTQPTAAQPNPQLRPQEVVRLIVDALGHNNADDSGIRTTWDFASPDNKQVTGPLERFIPMVKNRLYAPLMHWTSAHYAQVSLTDTRAQELVQLVDAAGNHAWYLFEMSKQKDGPQRGYWLTDGVLRVRPPNAPPTTQPHDTPPAKPAQQPRDDSMPV